MSKTTNIVQMHKEYAEVLVKRSGLNSYEAVMLIDIEDLQKIGKIRVTTGGYAYTTGVPSKNVAHLVMGHESNLKTVVDHINGNRLDNRKLNLRVVTQSENSTNRNSEPRNNTGVLGISERSVGNYTYYRATVSDRKTPMNATRPTGSKTRQVSKQFNINKLGRTSAFNLAKAWIEEKREEFGYLPK